MKINLIRKAGFALVMAAAFAGNASQVLAAPDTAAVANEALPLLKNPASLKWVKTIPEAGDRSPEYAILHSDPKTKLTMIMFRTPVAVHIKPHTHDLAETHVILVGGTHVFESNGVRYNVENGGFFRAPPGVVHEAWLPAGSQTVNILESGWVVNWIHGGPSMDDLDKYPPVKPH
jgi:quercetin dioxygenase-like cupin family protein